MNIDELVGINDLNYRTKINLITVNDVLKFVSKLAKYVDDESVIIKLADKKNWIINTKSILGCMAAIEWEDIYVYSNVDIYTQIMEFAA